MVDLMRPLSLPGFLSGVLMGAVAVWMMTATWIELAPASVLPMEYGIGRSSQTALDHCDFEDVLVLGDSKILVALDRPAMSFSILNLAEGGGTPAVDFYRTESVLHCNRLPKLVILSYSPLNLRHFSPWIINNLLVNRLLSRADLLAIVRRLEAEDGGSSIATLSIDDATAAVAKLPVPLQTVLYKADFPPLYWASILVSLREGIAGRWEANQQAAARAIHPVGHDYWDWPPAGLEGQAIFVHDASINGVPRSHALEGYFQLLVDRFAERGIPVLIAAMPINEPTSQAITQRAKDEYSAFLHSLSGGHGNVTVLEPIWTVLPSTSFADDSGHVNRAGQAEITRLIDRCVVALLHPAESHGAADCTMDHHAL